MAFVLKKLHIATKMYCYVVKCPKQYLSESFWYSNNFVGSIVGQTKYFAGCVLNSNGLWVMWLYFCASLHAKTVQSKPRRELDAKPPPEVIAVLFWNEVKKLLLNLDFWLNSLTWSQKSYGVVSWDCHQHSWDLTCLLIMWYIHTYIFTFVSHVIQTAPVLLLNGSSGMGSHIHTDTNHDSNVGPGQSIHYNQFLTSLSWDVSCSHFTYKLLSSSINVVETYWSILG